MINGQHAQVGAVKPKLGGHATMLMTVTANARQALASGDDASCREALAALLEWWDFRPSPGEQDAIHQWGKNPGLYASVPLSATIAPQIPGQIVPTPQGEMVVYFLQLAVPMSFFKPVRILGADGAENPAGDMLPSFLVRMVLPRARLAEETKELLGIPTLPSMVDLLGTRDANG